jgi:hypothetical protein
MTDVLFSFGDEHFYSNNLANWSSINSGQEIEIMGSPEKFSAVRINSINYNKPFSVISESRIKFDSNAKDLVLDGDTIDCYFKTYYVALVNDVIEKGSGYKVNEIVSLSNSSYFENSLDKKEKALFKVVSIDSNGGILELNLINKGKFCQNFNEAEIEGGSGKGAKLSVILGKNNNKELKFFSVLDVKHEDSSIIADLNEKIKDPFLCGEIYIKRYRITLNKPINKEYSSHPFIAKVEKTPFLNLPLAKDSNIEQIYNQAILTIDSKIKELSTSVK